MRRPKAAGAARLSIALVMLAAACSGGSDSSTAAPPSDVTLTLAPSARGHILTIAGTTNLPNGVLISYEVTPSDTSQVEFADGFAPVTDGRFTAIVDLNHWPAGDVEVWAAFQTVLDTTHEQPNAVIDRYGALGERLTGPNVTRAGDVRRVETTAVVTLGG